MMQEIKEKLRELATLLQAGGESDFAHTIDKALKTAEAAITDLLVSNDLWGGAGSIADQALIQNKELRRQLQHVLIELGELQQKIGKVNVRTEMWVSIFKEWRDQDTV